jgi:Rne/Rng family ribonuclease
VSKVEPALDAAFVDLGLDQHGFLRAGNIANAAGNRKHVRIDHLVQEGAVIPVQVSADGHESKGPILITPPRVSGHYLHLRPDIPGVLTPKHTKATSAAPLTAALSPLLAKNEGAIVRRTALDLRGNEIFHALKADLDATRDQWAEIEEKRAQANAPCCLDRGPEPIARLLSPIVTADVTSIVTSDHGSAKAAREWCERYYPNIEDRVEVWTGSVPLFDSHDVEAQIEAALAPRVALTGGGELIFERGTTLTMVDVNSAGFIGKANRMARDVNLAAVPELARQIRMRNIAGMVVVDILRMHEVNDRKTVLSAMRSELSEPRVDCDVLGISRLGLLELTRQRRGPSLAELMVEPVSPAQLRADVAAYAALRQVLQTARPGSGVILAAPPDVVAELKGPLAAALSDTERIAGLIHLRAESSWRRERAEIVIGTST